MNKKTISLVAILVGILLVGYLLIKKPSTDINNSAGFSNIMRGKTIEVTSNSLTVQGQAKSNDESVEINRKIVFKTTSSTVFKKSAITLGSKDNSREDLSGELSDIKKDTLILSIKSNDNLFKKDIVEATEVYYASGFVLPE